MNGRLSPGRKRVAVMQPYFFPYAGYFRLFADMDEFVIFDCVQFPRRGRVHRTEVPGPSGTTEWLTLPLARQPRNISIAQLEFAPGARITLDARLSRLPWVHAATGPHADLIRSYLSGPLTTPVDFLEQGLRLVAGLLDLPAVISRSSRLNLDPSLRGQARVIAIATAVGATEYVNAPGGRTLYEPCAFERAGMALAFLEPYGGRFQHLLPPLMIEPAADVRRDVMATLRHEWA
jgi:hypothetical protein